jgi:hypothetical protein
MSKTLLPTIAAYIDASNARQADALIAWFTPDAVVVDEGRTYRGSDEIREWFAQSEAAYPFTMEVTHVAEVGSETVVTRGSRVLAAKRTAAGEQERSNAGGPEGDRHLRGQSDPASLLLHPRRRQDRRVDDPRMSTASPPDAYRRCVPCPTRSPDPALAPPTPACAGSCSMPNGTR